MVEKKKRIGKKTGRKTSSGKSPARKNDAARQGGDDGESEALLKLEGALTVSGAMDLKDQLSAYLGKYRKVVIDASSVELIDTAALQLLTSFIRQLRQDSVEVSWAGKSEVLLNTAALLGLSSYLEF